MKSCSSIILFPFLLEKQKMFERIALSCHPVVDDLDRAVVSPIQKNLIIMVSGNLDKYPDQST